MSKSVSQYVSTQVGEQPSRSHRSNVGRGGPRTSGRGSSARPVTARACGRHSPRTPRCARESCGRPVEFRQSRVSSKSSRVKDEMSQVGMKLRRVESKSIQVKAKCKSSQVNKSSRAESSRVESSRVESSQVKSSADGLSRRDHQCACVYMRLTQLVPTPK